MERTPEELAHVRLREGAWTLAEIVGHLIDSACNNHQRFVRLRFGDLESFPGYDAEPWISAQCYGAMDFCKLAQLWARFNEYLLELVLSTPQDALGNVWKTPDGDAALAFLMEDYYAHMHRHVEHYAERLAEVEKHSA